MTTISYRPAVFAILAFIVVLAIGGGFITQAEQQRAERRRATVATIGGQQADSLQRQLDRSLSATFALASILRESGQIATFDTLATDMIARYGGITNLQLAPNGVVRQIVPLGGNESAIGHDLLNDPQRQAEARRAIAARTLTMSGPLTLVQGGTAVIGRLPVFVPDGDGSERFWGFTIVLIGVPDLLAASNLAQLEAQGYAYELTRVDPSSGQRVIFARSGTAELRDPVTAPIEVPNGTWTLSIAPQAGWRASTSLIAEGIAALLLALGAAGGTYTTLRQPERLRREVRRQTAALAATNRQLAGEVAERRQTEEALGASEARFRLLFEYAADAIIVHDRRGRIVDVNRRTVERLGYTRDELLRLAIPDIDITSRRDEISPLWTALQQGMAITIEGIQRRKDGTTFPVEVRLGLFHTAGEALILALCSDITARQAAGRREAIFSALGRQLSATRTAMEAARIVATAADDLFGWDALLLDLYMAENGLFRSLLDMDVVDGQRTEVRAAEGPYEPGPMLRRTLVEGAQLLLRDDGPAPGEPEVPLEPFGDTARRSASLMFVPIRSGAVAVGVLSIQSYTPGAYTPADLDALQALADHCGGALERLRDAEGRRRSEAGLVEAQRLAHLGNWWRDLDTDETYFSDELYRIHGYAPGQATLGQQDLLAATHPEDRESLRAWMAAVRAGQDGTFEHRLIRPDGTVRHVQQRAEVLLDAAGRPHHLSGTVLDITARVQDEEALLRRNEHLTALGEAGQALGTELDPDRALALAWDQVARVGGVSDGWLALADADADADALDFRFFIQGGVRRPAWESREARADGRGLAWALIDGGVPIRASDYADECRRRGVIPSGPLPDLTHASWLGLPLATGGRVVGALAMWRVGNPFTDEETATLATLAGQIAAALENARLYATARAELAERVRAEARLAHQATHDALTGLPNRALFLDRLAHALAHGARRRSVVAVLFLDLDEFKVVNDSLGHAAGDRLLVAVAERLLRCLRSHDTVARLGGDEFTLLLEDLDGVSEAVQVAERILGVLGEPVSVDGYEVRPSASIGIALSTFDLNQAIDLMRNGDIAMYRAKQAGKGRYAVFDSGMSAAAAERLELESDLGRAFERGEFSLANQPIVSLADGRVARVEALARWRHPVRGPVAPAVFVPLAEETGLIRPLGRWVLGAACRQAAAWRARHGDRAPVVCVNLSAREFAEPDLAAHVARALREADLPPTGLELEITEGVLMGDAPGTLATLWQLKDLGVGLAIDDFGTGYSSLAYLKRFPVDTLKIDRAFVERLGADTKDTAIVGSIIGLAHALGLQVVAEGVETADQEAELRQLGCDLAQGYHFARPLASADLDALLAAGPLPLPRDSALLVPHTTPGPAARGRHQRRAG